MHDVDEFVRKLTLPENLYWAWRKAQRFYRPGDVWFDEAEVAALADGIKVLLAYRGTFRACSESQARQSFSSRPTQTARQLWGC